MNERPIRSVELSPELTLNFSDRSNRYFGDYHRVLIEIDALVANGDSVVRLRYQRPLKRMGVCSADTAKESRALIDEFLAVTMPYMQQAGFAQKLLETMQRPGQRRWKRLG